MKWNETNAKSEERKVNSYNRVERLAISDGIIQSTRGRRRTTSTAHTNIHSGFGFELKEKQKYTRTRYQRRDSDGRNSAEAAGRARNTPHGRPRQTMTATQKE